jgi:hypothetical protein
MKKISLTIACCLFIIHGFSWGFFAHKAINRLAVFALPAEMFGFYKANIDFITEHAVDPDKRRYSDPDEACRHYVDLDYFEKSAPIDTVPFRWDDAVKKYSEDTLKAYGIVPWHIQIMVLRLTKAFKENDKERILRVSAEIGHYISDAHVPLHATMNYNGQLTNQHGIHGFWESRLPELYSSNYDFFVGKARYLDQTLQAAWTASQGSFAAKDSVLDFEKKLNTSFSQDNKYTYEMRGQTKIKQYSKGYAQAYHQMLGDQVERRMRESVLMVASFWYTAWVNAGQPQLQDQAVIKISEEQIKQQLEAEKKLLYEEKMIGREE